MHDRCGRRLCDARAEGRQVGVRNVLVADETVERLGLGGAAAILDKRHASDREAAAERKSQATALRLKVLWAESRGASVVRNRKLVLVMVP